MSAITFQLFGKFCVCHDGREFDVHALKEQELLSYLLINRSRPHSREMLAALLWGDSPTEKSKKYLRQALWHLQTAPEFHAGVGGGPVFVVENDWVRLNSEAELWLDVEVFERASALARGSAGRAIEAREVEALEEAVQIYRGDLLEGWYQDWCLFERERLQNLYFLMLDKLMNHCEMTRDYERGQIYGALILLHDRARERTHRQLMRLYYDAGDRTAALRQYGRCAAALREELGVRPDRHTTALYRRICSDGVEQIPEDARAAAEPCAVSLPEVLNRLRRLQTTLSDAQQQVQKDIKAVELALNGHR